MKKIIPLVSKQYSKEKTKSRKEMRNKIVDPLGLRRTECLKEASISSDNIQRQRHHNGALSSSIPFKLDHPQTLSEYYEATSKKIYAPFHAQIQLINSC